MSLCEINEKLKSFFVRMKVSPITDEVSCGRYFFRFRGMGLGEEDLDRNGVLRLREGRQAKKLT